MIQTLILEAYFNSAHLYHQPRWSAEKNLAIFGRCFTEHGHGHNYKLVAEFENPKDVHILKKKLDDIVKVLDHQHLNFVVPEFKNKIPTSEVICEYFQNKIESSISEKLLRLTLFETDEIGASLQSVSK